MLEQVEGMDETAAMERPLREAAKWCGTVDSKLESVRKAIELGRHLLTQNNLGVLRRLLDHPGDRRAFDEYLRRLPKDQFETEKPAPATA
jgi:hypothetical protein